jgi:poly(hydroxyalkanoate) depolymerase family esterase
MGGFGMRKAVLARAIAAAGLAVLMSAVATPRADATTLTQVTGFGSNPGNLLMYEYVPAGLSNRPVVVALHGCSQSAAGYDDESGWTKWADQMQFALVLPQQQGTNNVSKCFEWWLPGDQSRDQGEALSIKQMVDWEIAHHSIDPSRVFVTGLSAGAAMTNVMLAAYPDVFKGGAPVAGVPYKCATNVPQTGGCNKGNVNKTPAQWGDLVRGASSWAGPWPRVSIWHGTTDATVNYANLNETMEQWTNVNGVDQTADTTDTVNGFPHKVYKDGGGNARVETYSLTGMGHGQPIDPGTGAQQCGVAAAYFLDVNICSSYYIALWFGVNA